MTPTISRILNTAMLGAALLVPVSLPAQEHRTYHDERNKDEHHWDSHEDRAYRMWVKENHRKYRAFNRLRAEEQQNYWEWRHHHSDAELHITIR